MRRFVIDCLMCLVGGIDIGFGAAVVVVRHAGDNTWEMLFGLVMMLLGVMFLFAGIAGLSEDRRK